MNRLKFLTFPLLFIATFSFCQTDSLAVRQADWQTKSISRGIKLKTFWFNHTLFSSNQNITILQVKTGRKNKIDLGYEVKILKKTSEFGKTHNAVAALNGTFFDTKNGGAVDYIRSNGITINPTRLDRHQRADHQRAALIIRNGRISIAYWDGSQNWENKLQGEDIMVTGPALITDNLRINLDSTSFARSRHPRSAVAVKGKKVFLITVDGRNEKAAGMNLFELSSFLKWFRVDDAINLDGGGSTTLWVNGEPENGVVNYPSDNKKWDHAGERKVANVILVRKRGD